VSLTATSNAAIAYTDPNKSFTVPIKLTIQPPPDCTLAAPSAGQTALSVTASVSCTAPAGDALTATVNWGDGTAAATASATVASNGTSSFSSFSHTYASPSNPSYSIGLSVSDTTTGLAGSVTPPSVVITVLQTPTVNPSALSENVVQGQSVKDPVFFDGGPAEAHVIFTSVTCTVAPVGPTCSVSPTTLTLDGSGKGSVQVTVTTVGPGTTASIPRSATQQGALSASLVALPGLSVVLLGLGIFSTRSGRLPMALCLFLLVSLAIFGAGCGFTTRRSSIPCTSCTPAGTYTVTVTATSQKPLLQASGIFRVVVVD